MARKVEQETWQNACIWWSLLCFSLFLPFFLSFFHSFVPFLYFYYKNTAQLRRKMSAIRLSYAFFFFQQKRTRPRWVMYQVFNWNIKMNVFSFTLKVSYICNKEFCKNYCKNRCEPEVVSSENMLLASHCKFTVKSWFHEHDEITSEWKS